MDHSLWIFLFDKSLDVYVCFCAATATIMVIKY